MSKKEEIDVVDFCKAIQMIHELKQQLAEKDKEIEELKKDLKSQKGLADLYSTIAGTNATKMSIEKATRHQICEEIRKSPFLYAVQEGEPQGYFVDAKVLDQIEKGE